MDKTEVYLKQELWVKNEAGEILINPCHIKVVGSNTIPEYREFRKKCSFSPCVVSFFCSYISEKKLKINSLRLRERCLRCAMWKMINDEEGQGRVARDIAELYGERERQWKNTLGMIEVSNGNGEPIFSCKSNRKKPVDDGHPNGLTDGQALDLLQLSDKASKRKKDEFWQKFKAGKEKKMEFVQIIRYAAVYLKINGINLLTISFHKLGSAMNGYPTACFARFRDLAIWIKCPCREVFCQPVAEFYGNKAKHNCLHCWVFHNRASPLVAECAEILKALFANGRLEFELKKGEFINLQTDKAAIPVYQFDLEREEPEILAEGDFSAPDLAPVKEFIKCYFAPKPAAALRNENSDQSRPAGSKGIRAGQIAKMEPDSGGDNEKPGDENITAKTGEEEDMTVNKKIGKTGEVKKGRRHAYYLVFPDKSTELLPEAKNLGQAATTLLEREKQDSISFLLYSECDNGKKKTFTRKEIVAAYALDPDIKRKFGKNKKESWIDFRPEGRVGRVKKTRLSQVEAIGRSLADELAVIVEAWWITYNPTTEKRIGSFVPRSQPAAREAEAMAVSPVENGNETGNDTSIVDADKPPVEAETVAAAPPAGENKNAVVYQPPADDRPLGLSPIRATCKSIGELIAEILNNGHNGGHDAREFCNIRSHSGRAINLCYVDQEKARESVEALAALSPNSLRLEVVNLTPSMQKDLINSLVAMVGVLTDQLNAAKQPLLPE